ncbi:hypothetical protein ACH4OT_27195 [Streptomyces murinus]|uniref:hypothetical protein n=1 Tax=Streptomyces murinus TaxID=33900 RepID=UPI0037B1D693
MRKTLGPKLTDSSWDVIQGGFDSGNYWIYSSASPVGDILSRLGVRFASATASVEQRRLPRQRHPGAVRAADVQGAAGRQEAPVVGTPDLLPGSYSDAMGVVDSIENALRGQAG